MAEEGGTVQLALTPESISKLLADDLANIQEKVRNKKPLTEAEIKRLENAMAALAPQTTKSDAAGPEWADNQVELADKLHCSRKQVQRYLKLEGDEAPPAAAADGRYNVTLWKLWAQEHGLLRKKIASAADRQLLEDRAIQLRNERLEIENAVRRGELMSVDEVNRVLTDMVGGFVAGSRAIKHTLAPDVVGVPVPEATKRIGREVDEQLRKLSLGEWAKKKIFWSNVFAHLSALQKRYDLGSGPSAMS